MYVWPISWPNAYRAELIKCFAECNGTVKSMHNRPCSIFQECPHAEFLPRLALDSLSGCCLHLTPRSRSMRCYLWRSFVHSLASFKMLGSLYDMISLIAGCRLQDTKHSGDTWEIAGKAKEADKKTDVENWLFWLLCQLRSERASLFHIIGDFSINDAIL